MLKKILTYIFLFLFFIAQNAVSYAAKITNVSFDNSDNIMLIGTNAHELNCDTLNIKPVKLQEPDRIYFDIPDSILSGGKKTYVFKNTAIQQIKVAQFSTNPNTVRFVIYYNRNFNPDALQFYCTANNAITVVFSDNYSAKNNTISIYRTQNTLSSDLYEKTVYATEDKVQKISNNLPEAPSNSTNHDALAQIQKAIDMHTTNNLEPFNLVLDREFELKSNYFLKQVDIKRGNALLTGLGNIEIANPFILATPSRLVIDLPNTIISQNLRNKEYKLTENETIKIGQFEPSKARIVITTPTPEKYLSIMSVGTQSLLVANETRLNGLKFAEKNARLTSLKSTSSSDNTENFRINFDNPIVPAIKKNESNFEISLFNLENFDVEGIKRAAKNTKIQPLRVEKFSTNCLKLIFPLTKGTQINVYEHIDNKQLEIKFVLPKIERPQNDSKKKKKNNAKTIILDPGHGGSDVGATRQNVYEKDINLPVAQKVRDILEANGYNVYMTRDTDIFLSLQERVDFTNEKKADIFVSIHANSCAKAEISGIETHYYKNIDYELAQCIRNAMIKYVQTQDRGLFKSKFYVINHNEIPAVLMEIGFMTNPQELADMQTKKRQDATAKAIAEGIMNYLSRK